jgi:F-type H+-transporting ATPase subunit a
MKSLGSLLAALALGASFTGLPAAPLSAQDHAPAPAAALAATQDDHGPAQELHEAVGPVDIITPHITDGYALELPWIFPPFAKHVCIGRHVGEHDCGPLWDPIHIGGMELQLSPTKHVVMMMIAAALATIILVGSARSHNRATSMIGRPEGFANGIEAMVLYLRNEVILPNVGHHGERYVPYLLSLFFFILFANLLGLIPYGSPATGNISVTATLALITLIVTEVSGMRALGSGYLHTVFYWNKELPLAMRVPMFFIMTPVELISKLTKPFALTIRLFANMTAGHIVVLAFIGLIFTFQLPFGFAPLLMAVAIMVLEIFVSFLQAFIFTLLTAVFIGQMRVAHH